MELPRLERSNGRLMREPRQAKQLGRQPTCTAAAALTVHGQQLPGYVGDALHHAPHWDVEPAQASKGKVAPTLTNCRLHPGRQAPS